MGLPPVDVIVVARGGEALEDLWAFNEEIVARADRGFHDSVVSAVGHEIDSRSRISRRFAGAHAEPPAELIVPDTDALFTRCRQLSAQALRIVSGMVGARESAAGFPGAQRAVREPARTPRRIRATRRFRGRSPGPRDAKQTRSRPARVAPAWRPCGAPPDQLLANAPASSKPCAFASPIGCGRLSFNAEPVSIGPPRYLRLLAPDATPGSRLHITINPAGRGRSAASLRAAKRSRALPR